MTRAFKPNARQRRALGPVLADPIPTDADVNRPGDPVIIETLGLKSSQSRGILDPMKGAEHVVSDESRLMKLAHQYLEKAPANV